MTVGEDIKTILGFQVLKPLHRAQVLCPWAYFMSNSTVYTSENLLRYAEQEEDE